MIMTGVIETLRHTYGFVRGRDGVSRFFLPSAMQSADGLFDDLTIGDQVEFIHIDHPRGARALEIRVIHRHGHD